MAEPGIVLGCLLLMPYIIPHEVTQQLRARTVLGLGSCSKLIFQALSYLCLEGVWGGGRFCFSEYLFIFGQPLMD